MTPVRAALAALILSLPGAAHAGQGWYGAEAPRYHGNEYLYLSDSPLFRHDRLSRHRGFFDHGERDGTRFAYDRGYPYDYFSYGEEPILEPPPAGEMRCRTEWTRDRNRGEDVPVRICTGSAYR